MSTPDVSTQLREGGVEEWLVEAVERMARNDGRSLDPYLLTVGEPLVLANTMATSVLPRRFLGVCGRKHSRLRVQTRARAVAPVVQTLSAQQAGGDAPERTSHR